jgi:polyhydroxybutyrate depolymerase
MYETHERLAPCFAAVLALALLAAACGGDDGPQAASCSPARPAQAGTTDRSMTHDDLERVYQLSVPSSYDGTTAAPLILNLHGFGQTGGLQNEATDMPERGGARGYVVVAPDGAPLNVPAGPAGAPAEQYDGRPFWNFFGSTGVEFDEGSGATSSPVQPSQLGADDVGFLSALVDELDAELCIDETRIYATGLSNGAGMTTTLGCELGERLAAIAPVAGVNLTGACGGDAAIAILAVHGDADEAIHYEGNYLLGFELGNPSVPDRMQQWAEHNGCAAEPEVVESTGGVVRSTWPDCDAGAGTELWTIVDGPHAWPTGDPIDTTDVVLDFLDEHTLSDRE